MGEVGVAGGALTGAAGALLTIGLRAAAGDLGLGKGGLCALTQVGQMVADGQNASAGWSLQSEPGP